MPRPPILSRMRDSETGTKGTDHDRTKSGRPLHNHPLRLHGFNLHHWAYNGVAKNEKSRVPLEEVTGPTKLCLGETSCWL
jgi:hypothetical protein